MRYVVVIGAVLALLACADAAERKKPVHVAPAPVIPAVSPAQNPTCPCDSCDCEGVCVCSEQCQECACADCQECAYCGGCSEPSFRTPVRSFFHNRQPVRRVLRRIFRR